MAKEPKQAVTIRRGEYGVDVVGAATFIGLRGLDPLIQAWILNTSPLHRFFPSVFTSRSAANANIIEAHPTHPIPRFQTHADTRGQFSSPNGTALFTSPYLTSFNVSNFNQPATILWSMSVLTTAKHIYQMLVTTNEPMSAGTATIVSAFNTLGNTISSLLFTLRLSNPTYSDPSSLYVGAALFALGIIVEPVAETQRKLYKDRQARQQKASGEKSKSKPYTGGLFGLARNINYGAYTTWRVGQALAGGGWLWGAIIGVLAFRSFRGNSIPLLEDYMKNKYGEDEWQEVQRKVPYKLFPGIY